MELGLPYGPPPTLDYAQSRRDLHLCPAEPFADLAYAPSDPGDWAPRRPLHPRLDRKPDTEQDDSAYSGRPRRRS